MNKNLLLVAGGALTAFTIMKILRVVDISSSFEFTETVAKHLREEDKALKERFDQDIKDLKDEIEMLKKSSLNNK